MLLFFCFAILIYNDHFVYTHSSCGFQAKPFHTEQLNKQQERDFY